MFYGNEIKKKKKKKMNQNLTLSHLTLSVIKGTSPLFTSSNRLKIEKSKFSFSFQPIIQKFGFSAFQVRESTFSHILKTPLSLNEKKYTLFKEVINIQTSIDNEKTEITNCIFSQMNLNSPAILIETEVHSIITGNYFSSLTSKQHSIISLRDRKNLLNKNCFIDIFAENYIIEVVNGDKLQILLNTFQNCSKSIIITSQKYSYLQNINISNCHAKLVAKNSDLVTFGCTLSHITYSSVFESDFSYFIHLKILGTNFISSINIIKASHKFNQKSSVLISEINDAIVSNSYIMNVFDSDQSTCVDKSTVFFYNCYFYRAPDTNNFPISGDYIVSDKFLTKEMNMLNTFNCYAEFPSIEIPPFQKLNRAFEQYPKKTLIGLCIGPIIGITMFIFIYISLKPLLRQSKRKNDFAKSKNFAKGVTLLK